MHAHLRPPLNVISGCGRLSHRITRWNKNCKKALVFFATLVLQGPYLTSSKNKTSRDVWFLASVAPARPSLLFGLLSSQESKLGAAAEAGGFAVRLGGRGGRGGRGGAEGQRRGRRWWLAGVVALVQHYCVGLNSTYRPGLLCCHPKVRRSPPQPAGLCFFCCMSWCVCVSPES